MVHLYDTKHMRTFFIELVFLVDDWLPSFVRPFVGVFLEQARLLEG